MARPTKAESRRLERLEGISVQHYYLHLSTEILDLRLQQLAQRALEVGQYVELAREELGRLDARVESAQALLASELREGQARRR